jgi:hypothetical protein
LLLSNASSKARPCIDNKGRLTTDYTGRNEQTNEQILKRFIYAPRLGWPNLSNELGLSAPAPSPLPHRLSRGYLGLVLWGPVRLYGLFGLLHLELCGPEVALQEPSSVLWFSPTPPTL